MSCTSLGPGGLCRKECTEPGAESRAQAAMTTLYKNCTEVKVEMVEVRLWEDGEPISWGCGAMGGAGSGV